MSSVINNNYQVSNGAISQENIQNTVVKSKDAAVDSFENNSVIQSGVSAVTKDDNKREVILMLPVVMQANKLIDNLIGGSGNSGLLQKAANLGDNISHALHLDKVLSLEKQGKFTQKLKENSFTKYFTNGYAAVPKSSFAKRESLSAECAAKLDSKAQEMVSKIPSMVYENGSSFSTVKNKLSSETNQLIKDICPSLTPDYLSKVSDSISELSSTVTKEKEQQALAELQTDISKYLSGAKDAPGAANIFSRISSTLGKYKGRGGLTSETSNLISGLNKGHSTKQILNAVDDLSANGINLKGHTQLSSIRNKLKAANLETGETLLGKNLAKGTLKTKDILTYGGDILGLVYMTSALVQAGKAAKEAPKGEKKSTFMHVFSENYLGFVLLRPATKMVYAAAGNKYRGVNEAGRTALKDLVRTANSNPNLTKEGVKLANLQKKLLLKGVDSSKVSELAGMGLKDAKVKAKELAKQGSKTKLWEKPLKFAGQVLGTGLDDIKTHKMVNIPFLGEKMLPHPTLKGFAGGLGRFVIIMMVLQPLLQKPVTKLIHKIFGEPKTYLEKQKKQEEASANNQQEETNLLNRYLQPSQSNAQQPDEQINANQPLNMQQDNSQQQTQNQIQNDISAASGISDDSGKKNARYIPSIEVENKSSKQEQELEKYTEEILKRDEVLMKDVKKILGK